MRFVSREEGRPLRGRLAPTPHPDRSSGDDRSPSSESYAQSESFHRPFQARLAPRPGPGFLPLDHGCSRANSSSERPPEKTAGLWRLACEKRRLAGGKRVFPASSGGLAAISGRFLTLKVAALPPSHVGVKSCCSCYIDIFWYRPGEDMWQLVAGISKFLVPTGDGEGEKSGTASQFASGWVLCFEGMTASELVAVPIFWDCRAHEDRSPMRGR